MSQCLFHRPTALTLRMSMNRDIRGDGESPTLTTSWMSVYSTDPGIVISLSKHLFCSMECPVWRAGGQRPLTAGCLWGQYRVQYITEYGIVQYSLVFSIEQCVTIIVFAHGVRESQPRYSRLMLPTVIGTCVCVVCAYIYIYIYVHTCLAKVLPPDAAHHQEGGGQGVCI